MRIGMDLTTIWRQPTGNVNYGIELTRALLQLDRKNEYVLFFSQEIHPAFVQLRDRFEAVTTRYRHEVACKNLLFPFEPRVRTLSVLHFPMFTPPWRCACPYVWTIHDGTPWMFPETMTMGSRMYFRLLTPIGLRRASVIITDSETARQDLMRCLGLPPEKLEIVVTGLKPSFLADVAKSDLEAVRKRYDLPDRYLLFVGTVEPRKNLARLIRAVGMLKRERSLAIKLVVVGRQGWLYSPIMREVEKNNLKDQIMFAGYVPDADLPALYRMASLFVLPSLHEGFGVPPIEAMACGCPTVLSNAGSLPEIAGGAAYLVNPLDVADIARGIETVLQDDGMRRDLIRKGLERAKVYTWADAAKQALSIYERVGKGSAGNS